MADKTPRSAQSREASTRPTTWKAPSLLPTPDPVEGWEYRYIRSSLLGKPDNVNVSAKFREGWEPVPASEVPELMVQNDHDSRFPDNIEIGGLILCRIPTEMMEQRKAHHARQSANQIQAVDQNFMRANDPRMPLLAPERKTRVSRFHDD